MTFPSVELKFSQIRRTESETSFRVRLYRLDDGGIVLGHQQYVRTLLRERLVHAPAHVTKGQVLSRARQHLSEWATEHGYNLTADRLICTL